MTATLLLGIVSDTHGDELRARRAASLLAAAGVRHLLHCGDIGTPGVVRCFDAFEAHFVFGNCDAPVSALRAEMELAGQSCHERYGTLELAGCSIAFLHGDDFRRLAEASAAGTFDLVCHGHTHCPEQKKMGRTLVLNPGALHRANPRTIAIVELPRLHVRHVTVE